MSDAVDLVTRNGNLNDQNALGRTAQYADVPHKQSSYEWCQSWLTSAEAADYLRMSKHHFLRLRRQGEGPDSSGEGRLRRWRRSELDRWQRTPRKRRVT